MAGDHVLLHEIAAALEVGRRLDDLGVVWLIGGSVASSLLGEMRATTHVDLVADLRGVHVAPLHAALVGDFYADQDTMRWAVRERRSFNVVHDASMIKVDVFCAKDEPLYRDELSRRVLVDVGEQRLPIASAEDVVLQKLIWYREGGHVSDRQWKDALGVVLVNLATLDRTYLERHARDHGVGDLLSRILGES